MTSLQNFNGLTVIVGLGVTGLACVRYLVAQGVNVVVTDSRAEPPGLAELQREFPHVPCSVGQFNSAWLVQAQQLVVSPGVSLHHPEIAAQVQRGIPVMGDIELFMCAAQAPIVAITGSNGKTTVTTLVGMMVQAAGKRVAVGGNIGQAALDLLAQPVDSYVVELSSFQLESTSSLRSTAAVILNITPDHMDRYDSFNDYCLAKQRIYQHCQYPVVNLDQLEIWQTLNLPGHAITFGLRADADYGLSTYQGEDYLVHAGKPLLPVREIPLRQQHQLQNALAALALGSCIGLPIEPMLAVLRGFTGLPHRCQLVGEYQGVAWYNDSKGTNIGATIAAVLSLGVSKQGGLILIVGGDAKRADLSPLLEPVTRYVDQLILLGRDAPLFDQLLRDNVPCTHVASMAEAVKVAQQLTHAGDIVLLSPACASFDMFTNYEHRGDVFMQCVRDCNS